MDREFFKRTLLVLWFLTALDLVLWLFKTQTAVFFTVFVLLPLWAIWVWFNPHLEEEKHSNLKEGSNVEEKPTEG